ncbi:MAG: TonB-dependent receptor, partial [Candidatus Marinimicrobia bacterium]|nr:TonB-dependent receptor [Candidatus Neomarinimicrobiota bacterium]
IAARGGTRRLRLSCSAGLDQAPDFRLPGNVKQYPNQQGAFRNNSDYGKKSASLKIHYLPGRDHSFGLQLNHIRNAYNVPPNALTTRPRYWQFPEWSKDVISLNSIHVFHPDASLRTVWFYDQYYNVLESYDDDTYTTQDQRYAFTSTYDDYSLGAILYPKVRLLPFGLTNGVISLKEDNHQQQSDEDQPFERYSIRTWTAGLEQGLEISSGMGATIGTEVNYLQPTYVQGLDLRDPLALLNGQLALEYRFLEPYTVHLALGSKSRFPTLKELYSERLGRNIPNPQLEPEYSTNIETGIRWAIGTNSVQFAVYHSSLRSLITNQVVEQDGEFVNQYQNIGLALMQGLEINARGALRRVSWNLGYAFLEAENRTAGRDSDYLEYRPRHQLKAFCQTDLTSRLAMHFEGHYVTEQYCLNPDNKVWEKLDGFGVINMKLQYGINRVSLYARIRNVFDMSYMSEYGVPMPGRETSIGLRMEI